MDNILICNQDLQDLQITLLSEPGFTRLSGLQQDYFYCLNHDAQDYQDYNRIRQRNETHIRKIKYEKIPLILVKSRKSYNPGSDILLGIEQAVIF